VVTTGDEETGSASSKREAKAASSADSKADSKSTTRRQGRTPKPLSQRSPIVPAFFAFICLCGGLFSVFVYQGTKKVPVPHHPGTFHLVTTGPSTFSIILGVFYLTLAVVEGFIAYRIYRARGRTWR